MFLVLAVRSDLKQEIVSNRLILTGMAAGCFLQILCGFPYGLRSMILGCTVPFLLCWVLFRIRALGAGDIKLFCLIGVWNGLETTLSCMAVSFILAAVYALFHLIHHHQMQAAAADLLSYIQIVTREKKIISYAGRDNPKRRMHFSVAMIYGYLLVRLGGLLCGNIL